MCDQCEALLQPIWPQINFGQTYRTPDNRRGVEFEVSNVTQTSINISPQEIEISRDSFLATIHYLITHHHNMDTPCEIRSRNSPNQSGPLCSISREVNQGFRCINYILPILKAYVLVGIDGIRPNRTWLIN